MNDTIKDFKNKLIELCRAYNISIEPEDGALVYRPYTSEDDCYITEIELHYDFTEEGIIKNKQAEEEYQYKLKQIKEFWENTPKF